MSNSKSFGWSSALVALFLAAIALVFNCAPMVAQAEGLAITGAQLKLVQGNPEDMMRYPDNGVPLDGYPVPKQGDIVQVEDEFAQMTSSNYWPKITFYWEDCGQQADFDYRDHLGYLNGRIFAVMLSNAATWEWLGKAPQADLAGVRYIEVQGVPPAGFASLLARLPKRKIVVRSGQGCFASLPEALAPMEPLGLMVECWDQVNPLDLTLFSCCTFLSAELLVSAQLRLPPALKVLHLSVNHIGTAKLQGAEGSLETLRLSGSLDVSGWLVRCSMLKDVALISGTNTGDIAKVLEQLPDLQSLRIPAGFKTVYFLSSLKKLKVLWLRDNHPNIKAIADLKDLEFLSVTQPCDCDIPLLSALANLKYLDLAISEKGNADDGGPVPLNLSAFAPIAGKIFRLSLTGSLRVAEPEKLGMFTSLEYLTYWGMARPEPSVECISKLVNLRYLWGLHVGNQDLAPLARLTNLRSLELNAGKESDLSPLKGCASLRDLTCGIGEAKVAGLAFLDSLEYLSISANLGTGDADRNMEDLGYPALSNLKGLKILNLRVTGLRSVEFLGTLESLTGLILDEYHGSDLTVLGKLKSLKYLLLSRCENMNAVPAIQLPADLRALSLLACGMLSDLSFLDGAKHLATLSVEECDFVGALPELADPLASLTRFGIGSRGLVDTSGLTCMPALEILRISGFSGEEMTGLDALKSLRNVGLGNFSKASRLPKTAPEAPIVEVSVSGGEELTSLGGIEAWKSIRKLTLAVGKKITDLTPLASLAELEYLTMSGGEAIKDVTPITKMSRLKWLNIEECDFSTRENNDLLQKALPGCQFFFMQEWRRNQRHNQAGD
ncbi:MAG: hypothetical protein WC712_11115 [Candidatus Brocadiia bacterium]